MAVIHDDKGDFVWFSLAQDAVELLQSSDSDVLSVMFLGQVQATGNIRPVDIRDSDGNRTIGRKKQQAKVCHVSVAPRSEASWLSRFILVGCAQSHSQETSVPHGPVSQQPTAAVRSSREQPTPLCSLYQAQCKLALQQL